MINRKYIISSIILVASIAISAVSSYSFKATADEETLTQVKMQLQEQIDEKSKELEDKDRQLEDLNNKVTEQSLTIDQLNNSINTLNEGLSNTNVALDNAKKSQKQDKADVITHSDSGDANLQSQVNTIKENQPRQLTDEEKAELEKASHGTKVQRNEENNNTSN